MASTRDNEVTLILHGEIYEDGIKNQAEFLLKRYLEKGYDFAKGTNGSYAVLLIDRRDSSVAVITDRLSSRKVFYGEHDGIAWLSTALTYHMHPVAEGRIDPVGIAHYLVNGIPLNNRTLFADVSVLNRASVHTLAGPDLKLRSTQYWTYRLDNAFAGRRQDELEEQLSTLLTECTRRRVADRPHVYLSLSGGHDSTCILGALSRLGVKGVDCFSYCDGPPTRRSDAAVAGKMARIVGCRHITIPAYQRSFLEVLKENAAIGQGVSWLLTEPEVWRVLEDQVSSGEGVLFFGDEHVGRDNSALASEDDVFRSANIRDFNALRWLRGKIPNSSFAELSEAVREDLSDMTRRCPRSGELRDMRDYLYLDVRLNKMLVSREFFAGRVMTVRNPLLDNEILDFVAHLPPELRRGRQTFKRAAEAAFPHLFQIARARDGNPAIDRWAKEKLPADETLELLALDQQSPLDGLIPPDLLLSLYTEHRGLNRRLEVWRRYGRPIWRRFLRTGAGSVVRRGLRPTVPPRVKPTTFLARAIFLRLVLRERVYGGRRKKAAGNRRVSVNSIGQDAANHRTHGAF